METPDQYREYAAECFRLASKSKTEADRETLLELARAWKKVAEEAVGVEEFSHRNIFYND